MRNIYQNLLKNKICLERFFYSSIERKYLRILFTGSVNQLAKMDTCFHLLVNK